MTDPSAVVSLPLFHAATLVDLLAHLAPDVDDVPTWAREAVGYLQHHVACAETVAQADREFLAVAESAGLGCAEITHKGLLRHHRLGAP